MMVAFVKRAGRGEQERQDDPDHDEQSRQRPAPPRWEPLLHRFAPLPQLRAQLAGARGRHRAAHPPDGCELHQRRGDGDDSRARRSRRRADPDPRLAGERRLGAPDGARPAPRADRPGPLSWTDASGRRALAVAARLVAGPHGRRDRGPARSPGRPGRWELEALELDEPTGVAITNGHQNGENPAAATQSATRVALGPMLALPADGPSL